jgi:hypothetical protein
MDQKQLLVRRLKKAWNKLSVPHWRALLWYDFGNHEFSFPTLHNVVDVLLSAGMTTSTWDTYWKSRESFIADLAHYKHHNRWKQWELWNQMKQENQVDLFHPSVKIMLCEGCNFPVKRRVITCSSSVIDYNHYKVTLVESETGNSMCHWFQAADGYRDFYMGCIGYSSELFYAMLFSRWLWKQERLLEYTTFLQCFTHPVPKTPLHSFRNHKLCDDCVVTHVIRSFVTS